MNITLNITEDCKVEVIRDDCEAVQSESNVTILNINFPSTIKGYSIDNYSKKIEFGECKDLGECSKFWDVVEGNVYKLCDICTQFKKIMIQFTLTNLVDEAEPVVWKTIPFALEFRESINAEKSKEAQVILLSLEEILLEWENFIKANTLRVVYRAGDVPTADEGSLGDTIFYLGADTTSPYVLTYGHYYRCNYANEAYEWTDLTRDPSLDGVANGIREINKNQTWQVWGGTKEELENEVTQPNVLYFPLDHDVEADFDEILTSMIGENEELLLDKGKKRVPVLPEKFYYNELFEALMYGDFALPRKKKLVTSTLSQEAVTNAESASITIPLGETLVYTDYIYILLDGRLVIFTANGTSKIYDYVLAGINNGSGFYDYHLKVEAKLSGTDLLITTTGEGVAQDGTATSSICTFATDFKITEIGVIKW